MAEKPEVVIRPFNSADREAVRKISCETSFLGENRRRFFDDDILADALTIYFTDYEPQSSFVAQADQKVIGYIIGAKDAKKMQPIMASKIIPQIIIKSWRKGLLYQPHNLNFFWSILISAFKGEFWMPPLEKTYPAILHINIYRDFRAQNVGTRLMEAYLNYLKQNHIPGVYLGTVSEQAKKFFVKSGFSLLFRKRRTYLKYHLGREFYFYIFAKSL